jgi:hypothetical protein
MHSSATSESGASGVPGHGDFADAGQLCAEQFHGCYLDHALTWPCLSSCPPGASADIGPVIH